MFKSPPDVNPVFSLSKDTTCWEPEGKAVYLYDVFQETTRLWRVDTSTLEWELVASFAGDSGSYGVPGMKCSPDGRWVAWGPESIATGNGPEPGIIFVNSVTGEIIKHRVGDPHEIGGMLWVEDDSETPLLMLSDNLSEGLFIIEPQEEGSYYRVAKYSEILQQLPHKECKLYLGTWRP
jgi:hypothetical protein